MGAKPLQGLISNRAEHHLDESSAIAIYTTPPHTIAASPHHHITTSPHRRNLVPGSLEYNLLICLAKSLPHAGINAISIPDSILVVTLDNHLQ